MQCSKGKRTNPEVLRLGKFDAKRDLRMLRWQLPSGCGACCLCRTLRDSSGLFRSELFLGSTLISCDGCRARQFSVVAVFLLDFLLKRTSNHTVAQPAGLQAKKAHTAPLLCVTKCGLQSLRAQGCEEVWMHFWLLLPALLCYALHHLYSTSPAWMASTGSV